MKISEIRALLIELKKQIGDEYRADECATLPSMCVTIATTDGKSWTYQTGDNSYSGGCYGMAHWHVLSLYRRDNCTQLARECVAELRGMVADAKAFSS